MRRVEVKKIMKKNQVIITSLAILIAVEMCIRDSSDPEYQLPVQWKYLGYSHEGDRS